MSYRMPCHCCNVVYDSSDLDCTDTCDSCRVNRLGMPSVAVSRAIAAAISAGCNPGSARGLHWALCSLPGVTDAGVNDASSHPDVLCAGDIAITVSGGDNSHISALLHEAIPAGVTTHGDMTSGGARWFSSVSKWEKWRDERRAPLMATMTVTYDEPTEEDRKNRTLRGVKIMFGDIEIKGIMDDPFVLPDEDPFDVEYDGVPLSDLLKHDEYARHESSLALLAPPVWLIGQPGMKLTPAQRAAVSAYWSAQLRLKMADAEKSEPQVVMDCAEEL